MAGVKSNFEAVQKRIGAACQRCVRDAQDVQVVAISKTMPVSVLREAVTVGIRMVGENRVQEAAAKIAEIGRPVAWHLVGHLQSNKVRRALELFDVIQSVDSALLARELDFRAGQMPRMVEVLMEVNTSAEPSKYGVRPEEADRLAKEIARCKNLRLTGLMTVGAWVVDAQQVRPCFQLLREIRDGLNRQGLDLVHLSMGMSNDFEQAIEEGATLIRLGRALFGERT